MKTYQKILIAIGILIILFAVLILLRGNEDSWIKDNNGNWVRHGNPSSPMPEN